MEQDLFYTSFEGSSILKVAQGSAWVGAGSQLSPQVSLGPGCLIGRKVTILGQVVLGSDVQVGDAAVLYGPLEIGSHARIARDVYIGSQHNTFPIQLGPACRLGRYATIFGGVTVGEAAFIKAETRLFGDVPAHALVGGNPAALFDFLCPCAGPLVLVQNHLWRCAHCNAQLTLLQPALARLGHILCPGAEIGPFIARNDMDTLWNDRLEF